MEPYSRIGPVLLSRYVFSSGTFRIQKVWFGYEVVRTEVYSNEIFWENGLASDKWTPNKARYQITYTLSRHLTYSKASETLQAFRKTYQPSDNIFPKYVGDIGQVGNDFRITGIRKFVKHCK